MVKIVFVKSIENDSDVLKKDWSNDSDVLTKNLNGELLAKYIEKLWVRSLIVCQNLRIFKDDRKGEKDDVLSLNIQFGIIINCENYKI